ncbi:MAG TPA: putative collagen-binding domain-containing protein [Paludibacter sp.]|nr:putative collagen-binding domain-containing protein [Paludibacter sp.]
MTANSEFQNDFQDKNKLSAPERTAISVPGFKSKVLGNIAGFPVFKITICLLLMISISPFRMNCSATERSGISAISIYPKNTYYFQDAKGKPLIFIGDYTWETFSGVDFDYVRMFDSLKSRGLNLARVWLWKGCEAYPPPDKNIHIEPYLREGPGLANDGKPKYNLDKFNPAFFERIVELCKSADRKGINLDLMMIDAWMLKHDYLWRLNTYNRNNNINNVDGDPQNTKKGNDGKKGFCSMGNPKVLEYQKAYIRKVVETVNSFDKIYFEIANENYYSEEWELTLCDFIKEIELKMPNQHMTIRRDFPSHSYVVQKWDPVTVHKGIMGKRNLKVPLLFDTDWMINKNDNEIRKAAWSAVASGAHFSYMDDAMEFRTDSIIGDTRASLHNQIDFIARFMKDLKPWEMTPDDSLVKSGLSFAMANNKVLFAYLPGGGEVSLDLSAMKGKIMAKWYNPLNGEFGAAFQVAGKPEIAFHAPDKNDWALLIKSK